MGLTKIEARLLSAAIGRRSIDQGPGECSRLQDEKSGEATPA